MIKLSTYMKPLDVDSVIALDEPFNINGITYKLYKNSGSYRYALIKGLTVIGVINPSGAYPTFRDIYKYLALDVPAKRTLSAGDIIFNGILEDYNIISNVNNHEYFIVSLANGNRWHEPDTAEDIYNITNEEIKETLGSSYDKFSYVGRAKDCIVVKPCW